MHTTARSKVVARIVATVALLLASGSMLSGGPLASAGVPVRVSAVQPASKIAPDVLRATDAGQVASIAILLADQADVSAAYSMADRNARGRYVYNTLKAHADRTQAGLRAELDALGVTYSSFWVANVIFARGDRTLVERLAARNDVKLIESNAQLLAISDPVDTKSGSAPLNPQTVAWGVQKVNAPQVWDLGYTGHGIVVGIQDTGMRWTHNALKPHYRGWNGDSADHNYNWWDAIHSGSSSCAPNLQAPCDDNGHGTHVLGSIVGDDGNGNQIGVAPGAKWIGCRNMRTGIGSPQTYTECFEFFMAPKKVDGSGADPTLRPHIVNNSWGCPPSEGCAATTLQTVVENTQASGIFVVTSTGNAGPECATVDNESQSGPPGIYAASFATGAIDSSNTLASFSSRGPVLADGSNRRKPDIVGPGVSVQSSTAGSDSSYGFNNGTSMASPHVAGTIALLWNVWPELQREITTTKQLLQDTANPNITVNSGPTSCGGIPNSTVPNNAFGYGLVDAYAAVHAYCETTSQDVFIRSEIAPANITIPAGSTVRWTSEGDTHTSTSNTGLWDSGNIAPGESFSHTFNTPGVYSYQCKLHPNMAGTINVTDPCSVATATPTSSTTATSTWTATSTATSISTATSTSTSTSTPSNTSTATVQASATTTVNSPTPTRTATLEPPGSPTPCASTVDVRLGSSARSGPSGACPPPPSATPTTTGCAIQFADVPATGQGSTFYSFVRCLACRSIVGGYPCGGTGEPCNSGNQPYFRPGANVTRGQIAKMVALAADLDAPTGEQTFQDVPPGSTFYGPVQQLATAGYIGGYPCGAVPTEPCETGSKPYFRPGANATRGQLSKIVSETAQMGGDPGSQRFTDVPEDSPFYEWVNRLANQGVMSGYPCGDAGEPCDDQDLPYFRPGANVTRGQTAKIVANTFYPNCQTP